MEPLNLHVLWVHPGTTHRQLVWRVHLALLPLPTLMEPLHAHNAVPGIMHLQWGPPLVHFVQLALFPP